MADAKAIIATQKDAPKPEPIDYSYRVPGYPRLAEEIGKIPQLGIFRRFGALNARSMLYMQAELVYLEQRLIVIEERERTPRNDMRWKFAGNWFRLSSAEQEEAGMRTQWDLVLEIREKLKEYSM